MERDPTATVLNFTITFLLGLLVYYKNPRKKVNIFFFLFTLILTYWEFVNFLISTAESFDRALFWSRFDAFYLLSGVFFSLFIIFFTGREKLLKNIFVTGIILLPGVLISFLDVITNEFSWELKMKGDGWELVVPDSIYYLIVTIWALFVVIFCAYLLISFYFKPTQPYQKKQTRIILIGFVFPLIGNVATIVASYLGFGEFHIPLTGTTVVNIFMAYAIWKFDLFLLNPITAAESIIDNMSDILFLVGPDHTIMGVNTATVNIIGLKQEKILYKGFPEFIDQESYPFTEEVIEKIQKKGVLVDHQSHLITSTNKRIPISMSITTVYDRRKNLLGYVCLIRDITERRIHQEELETYNEQLITANSRIEEEKAKAEAVLQSIGDGLIVTDTQGNIILLNQAFENLLGWKQHEVKNRKLMDIIPIEDKDGNKISEETWLKELKSSQGEKIKETHISDITKKGEYFFVRKDGSRFPVVVTKTPIVFGWSVIGLVEVFRDVSKELDSS